MGSSRPIRGGSAARPARRHGLAPRRGSTLALASTVPLQATRAFGARPSSCSRWLLAVRAANFQVESSIHFQQGGRDFDLHNDYDFIAFSYSVAERVVELYDLAPATDAPAFFELSAVRR